MWRAASIFRAGALYRRAYCDVGFRAPLLIRRTLSVKSGAAERDAPPIRVCVVGSGPAGFYTTASILKEHPTATVDIVEAMPFPFGLVRLGVAPDHPEVKSVENRFTEIANDERVKFYGNVKVGSSPSLEQLMKHYHATVLAYGASKHRPLRIPGEHLPGVTSATSLVGWYNGHPEHQPEVSEHIRTVEERLRNASSALVIGNGNVALDITRMFVQLTSNICSTDITSNASQVLDSTTLKRVHLFGRRGPAQAAFTNKELRELTSLEGVRVFVRKADMELNEASRAEARSRTVKRMLKILKEGAEAVDSFDSCELKPGERGIFLHFCTSPTEFRGQEHLESLQLEKTTLEGDAGVQRAVGTGEHVQVLGEVAVVCIGYDPHIIPGLPTGTKGEVVQERGRVLGPDGAVVNGLYVSGWLKRGPSGIIGTNLWDSSDTALSLIEDARVGLLANPVENDMSGLEALFSNGVVDRSQVVVWDGWERIDAHEKEAGAKLGKEREKETSIQKLLQLSLTVPTVTAEPTEADVEAMEEMDMGDETLSQVMGDGMPRGEQSLIEELTSAVEEDEDDAHANAAADEGFDGFDGSMRLDREFLQSFGFSDGEIDEFEAQDSDVKNSEAKWYSSQGYAAPEAKEQEESPLSGADGDGEDEDPLAFAERLMKKMGLKEHEIKLFQEELEEAKGEDGTLSLTEEELTQIQELQSSLGISENTGSVVTDEQLAELRKEWNEPEDDGGDGSDLVDEDFKAGLEEELAPPDRSDGAGFSVEDLTELQKQFGGSGEGNDDAAFSEEDLAELQKQFGGSGGAHDDSGFSAQEFAELQKHLGGSGMSGGSDGAGISEQELAELQKQFGLPGDTSDSDSGVADRKK